MRVGQESRPGEQQGGRPPAGRRTPVPEQGRGPRSEVRRVQGRAGNAAAVQLMRRRSGAAARSALPAVQRAPIPERVVSPHTQRRLSLAKDAVAFTKALIPHSGNQQPGLTATLYNARIRSLVMRNNAFWDLSGLARLPAMPSPATVDAAKAHHAKGGHCGENASVAYSYLRWKAKGEWIHKASTKGLDHAYVLIGRSDEQQATWTVADPWPTGAQPCLWDEHFAYNPDPKGLDIEVEQEADGAEDFKIASGLISLTTAGKNVAEWSLENMRGWDLQKMHHALGMFKLAPPGPATEQSVLQGLQQVAASDLRDVNSWSLEQLWLWCASQVEPKVLLRTLKHGPSADQVGAGLDEARQEAAAAGGKYWVWSHSDTTRQGGRHRHILDGQQGAPAPAGAQLDDHDMDLS